MALKISFAADNPPLSAIAAVKLAGVEHSLDSSLPSGSSPSLIFSDGSELRGANVLLRYFGRIAKGFDCYGRDAYEASQIEEWLEYSPELALGPDFEIACSCLDNYLLQRTLFVGYSFSIADIAIWAGLAVTGKRWESLRKSNKYQNLVRWYNSISTEYSTVLQEAASYAVIKESGKGAATKSKIMVDGDAKEVYVYQIEADMKPILIPVGIIHSISGNYVTVEINKEIEPLNIGCIIYLQNGTILGSVDHVAAGDQFYTITKENLHTVAMKRLKEFKNFAFVDDYSDHRFVNMSQDVQLQRDCVKQIEDEWKILESALPADTIFVRAYESKMNLLRAVIIGPQGTPYHDALFFFDVMFPYTYPFKPPRVHYHSGSLIINPHISESGKICLSLLGTVHGRSTEKWIPGKSTLLQVLVSIQGLVLVEEPYADELAFMERHADEPMNEEVLINSLKTMLHTMRKPLKHFEGFVADHFITRAHDILLACKAYMDGAQVGSVSIVEGKIVRGNNKSCSPLFKEKVEMIMKPLMYEFAKLGVKSSDGYRVPESMNKEPPVNNLDYAKAETSNPGFGYPVPHPQAPLDMDRSTSAPRPLSGRFRPRPPRRRTPNVRSDAI